MNRKLLQFSDAASNNPALGDITFNHESNSIRGNVVKAQFAQLYKCVKQAIGFQRDLQLFDIPESHVTTAATRVVEDLRVISETVYKETFAIYPLAGIPAVSQGLTLSKESLETPFEITEGTVILTRASEAISGGQVTSRKGRISRNAYLIQAGFTVPGMSLLDNSYQGNIPALMTRAMHECLKAESVAVAKGDSDMNLYGLANLPTVGEIRPAFTWGGTNDSDYTNFVTGFNKVVSHVATTYNMWDMSNMPLTVKIPGNVVTWLREKMYPGQTANLVTCWKKLVELYPQITFEITNELNGDADNSYAATLFVAPAGQLNRVTCTPTPFWWPYMIGRDIRYDLIQQVAGVDCPIPDMARRVIVTKA